MIEQYELRRGERQGNGAIASIALLLCHGLILRAVSIKDGYIQTAAQLCNVGGGASSKRFLLILSDV